MTQLAAAAGQAEDITQGQAVFQQALALALRYNSPKWDMHFVYVHNLLLSWQHSTGSIVGVVKQVFPELMAEPYETVRRLLVVTWPELQVRSFTI